MLNFMRTLSRLLQLTALTIVGLSAIGCVIYTVACIFGLAPWLEITVVFGETAYASAGQLVQSIFTIALVAIAFMIPTHGRVMTLEKSHRDFHMTMQDVAQAYHHCHSADRSGLFTMSSEFDAVRERIAYLRDHPDLSQLEPKVLEVAAQMSQQSRELADVYSDAKVARAKEFLRQRQEEVEAQQDRIVNALHATQEISMWAQQVELEESIVASQLGQLDEKLQAALPALGYTLGRSDDNIIPLEKKPAAE